MDLISTDLGDVWPASSLKKAYEDIKGNIFKVFAVSRNNESEDPNHTALTVIRIFIEKGTDTFRDQKYIIGLRFYNFGDMATIDIISLDRQSHIEIAKEHAKRMGWIPFPEPDSGDAFRESYSVPMVISGAHLKMTNKIVFFSKIGDFGSSFFGTDSNELAREAFRLSGLSTQGSKEGGIAIENILRFMFFNKTSMDFYERFVKSIPPPIHLAGQNYGGLLAMKIADRMIFEKTDDYIRLVIEELTDPEGLGKRCLLINAAKKANGG